MHAAKADGAWAPAAARADLALAKSLGASALCTDAFLADDPNEGAKLQTFVQTAKPVKVIIGRRAFDDVLERRPHMAERRDVLNRLGRRAFLPYTRREARRRLDGAKTPEGVITHSEARAWFSYHHCERRCGLGSRETTSGLHRAPRSLPWTTRTRRSRNPSTRPR